MIEKELESLFEKHKEELIELDTQRLEETFDLIIRIVKSEQQDKLLIKILKDRYKNIEKEQDRLLDIKRNYQLYGPEYELGREFGRLDGRKEELSKLIDTLISKDLSILKPTTYISLNLLGGNKND